MPNKYQDNQEELKRKVAAMFDSMFEIYNEEDEECDCPLCQSKKKVFEIAEEQVLSILDMLGELFTSEGIEAAKERLIGVISDYGKEE